MYQRNGRLGISNQRVRHISFYVIVSFFLYYQLIPLSIILCYLGKSLTDHDLPGPTKDHIFLALRPAEPHATDRRSLFSLEKQKSLNINIASYFLETLTSPHKNTWHHRGGPIKQIIDHFFS